MIELFKNNKDCCGCGACANICSQGAITMVKEDDTFCYPTIDHGLCIKCNACTKVCPISNENNTQEPKHVWAATYHKRDFLQQSSSGGIFAAVATYILSIGGIVFGTTLDEQFSPSVISIDNLEDLPYLQGSKYVQSNTKDCFLKILDALKLGRTVLFCGTPCQTAAVKNYASVYAERLYLLDIICHGVPSEQLFHDYISYLEYRKHIRITNYKFRDKRRGQDDYFSYSYEKRGHQASQYHRAAKSSYYKLFLNNSILRESCYHCKFASKERIGDISICDYWGIEREHPKFEEQIKRKNLCGISGVLVNTAKGEALISQIESDLCMTPSSFDQVSKHNSQLLKPSKANRDREKIMQLYQVGGYEAIDRFYFKKYRWNIVKGDLGSMLPLSLRKKINHLLRGKK